MTSRKILLSALLLAACGLARVCADEPPEKKSPGTSATKQGSTSSLDEELLKGLGNDLLDDLDDLPKIKPADKAADANKPSAAKPKPDDQQTIDGEDLGQPGEDRDPLTRISRRMRDVETRIARNQAGDATQKRQKEIVDELASLIDQAKKQCQDCQNAGGGKSPGSQRSKVSQSGQKSGGNTPTDRPARDSSNQQRRDKTAKADPASIRERMKEAWGNLPERIREQMMQSSVDEFLPKYELLIEKYFQRLAEEETPPPR